LAADQYTLRRTGLSNREDDFVFRFNARDVGRTYAETTPQGLRWYWSVYGINLRGPLPEGVVLQGLADDLPAAKAVFKTNWVVIVPARARCGRLGG
jgi:hypothetical protein